MAEHRYRHEAEIDPEGRRCRPAFDLTAADEMASIPGRVATEDETLRGSGETSGGVSRPRPEDAPPAARIRGVALQPPESQEETITTALGEAIREQGLRLRGGGGGRGTDRE